MRAFFLIAVPGFWRTFSTWTTRLMQVKLWRLLLAFALLFPLIESAGPVYAARVVSKRLQYLGKTPGKKTKTGKAVLKRWHESDKARWTEKGTAPDYAQTSKWEVSVYTFDSATKTMSDQREWLPLDKNIAMGHKLAAVDFWNKGAAKSKIYSPIGNLKKKAVYKARYKPYQQAGRKGRAKSEIVRRLMLDPLNYRFEHLPANSHFGGQMTDTYKEPKS